MKPLLVLILFGIGSVAIVFGVEYFFAYFKWTLRRKHFIGSDRINADFRNIWKNGGAPSSRIIDG